MSTPKPSVLSTLTASDYVKILIFVLPILGSAVGLHFRMNAVEQRQEVQASRESVQRVEERVVRLERAVDDIREIKADVRYILGILEGSKSSER